MIKMLRVNKLSKSSRDERTTCTSTCHSNSRLSIFSLSSLASPPSFSLTGLCFLASTRGAEALLCTLISATFPDMTASVRFPRRPRRECEVTSVLAPPLQRLVVAAGLRGACLTTVLGVRAHLREKCDRYIGVCRLCKHILLILQLKRHVNACNIDILKDTCL